MKKETRTELNVFLTLLRQKINAAVKNTNFIIYVEEVRYGLEKENKLSTELNNIINCVVYKMLDNKKRFGFPFVLNNINTWIKELEKSNKIKK